MATVVAMVGTMMLSVALVAINIAAPESKEVVAPPPKARVKQYTVRDTNDNERLFNVLGSNVDTVEKAVLLLRQYVQGMQGFEGVSDEGKERLRGKLAAVSSDLAGATSLSACVALASKLQSIKAEWDKLKAVPPVVVDRPSKTANSKGASDDSDGYLDSDWGSDDDEY